MESMKGNTPSEDVRDARRKMEEEFWRTQREVGASHLGLIRGLLDGPDLAGPQMQNVRQKLETVRDWLTQDRSAARRATRSRTSHVHRLLTGHRERHSLTWRRCSHGSAMLTSS